MSVKLMSLVWDTEIGPLAKRMVMLAIADAASDEGCCWPAMSTIARKSGVAVSTAREAVANLESDGYLSREIRPISGDRNESNRYWIDVAKLRGAARIWGEVPPERGESPTGEGRGNRNLNRKEEPKSANDAVAPSPEQPPALFEASPEVTPAVPAPSSSKESRDATELASRAYQLWLENWDGTLNGRYTPSGAEATYDGIKEIAGRFDVDPEALMRAAEQASADGKYAVRSFYQPGTPSGARLTRMAQEVATKIYEARNKQINFMAVRARVKTALSGGYEPGDIYRGTIALFEAGKPPTQQLVAQYADSARMNRLAALNSRGKVER
jgi:hypothetical protein